MAHRLCTITALLLAGCSAPPGQTPAPNPPSRSLAKTSAPAVTATGAVAPPEAAPAAPEPDPKRAALRAYLDPKPGTALLRVGLHVDNHERYYPLPQRDRVSSKRLGSGYRTLAIRTDGGAATVETTYPYLVVHRESGPLFIGEAHVGIHEADDPRDKNGRGDIRPHDYDATALWSTTEEGKVKAVEEAAEAKLRAAKVWGAERIERIVYITPRARCQSVTTVSWTGGEAWFKGSNEALLDAVSGKPIDARLSGHVDDSTLRHFAGRAFGIIDDADPRIDVDKPYRDDGRWIRWRSDAHVCLGRVEGHVKLMGTVLRSGNTQLLWTVRIPVWRASEDLAPSNAFAVDFHPVVSAFPDATDVFASPTRDVLLVVQGDQAIFYDVLRDEVKQKIPFDGRIVMAEWVTGD
jgi:hypothetical protein